MQAMRFFLLLSLSLLGAACRAQSSSLKEQQFTVDGIRRVALIAVPASAASGKVPVVFAFHGHGGSMRNTSRSWRLHTAYPEAVVAYMQGMPTPGQISDPEGKRNGWQHRAGDHGDRDLKFFDAVLTSLKKQHPIDPKRVFAVGHSNGGAFTYLLSAQRPSALAAIAVVGAAGLRNVPDLTPKPTLHVAGQNDPLVRFSVQERMMQVVRQVNGCEAPGKPWAKSGDLTATLYPSAQGASFVEVIHPNGHEFPSQATGLIVKFFRQVTPVTTAKR